MSIAVVAAAVAIVSSILGPVLVLGAFAGRVRALLAVYKADLERHSAGIANKGERIEALGRELSELRGELKGRGVIAPRE